MYDKKIINFNPDPVLFWKSSSNAQIHLSKLSLFNELQYIKHIKKINLKYICFILRII